MIATGFIMVDGESRPMFSSSKAGLICQVFTVPPPVESSAVGVAPVSLIARRPGFNFIELPDGNAVEIQVPGKGMTQEIWEKAITESRVMECLQSLTKILETSVADSASGTAPSAKTPALSSVSPD